MANRTKNIIVVTGCLLTLFCSECTFAQTLKITGTVKNNREVLQGATVKVKHTGQHTTTDADGRYEITVEPNIELQIFAKGHQKETVKIENKQRIDVLLSPDTVYLNKFLLKKVKEIEPYAHFLQAEKQAIVKPTPVYYNARLAFVKDLYFNRPHRQAPDEALNKFLNYCKANNLFNGNEESLKKAARTLGFELITDASPVNMEQMISASSAYRNIRYTKPNGYSQKLDLFLPKVASQRPIPCIIFIHDGGWAVHKRAWFEAHARYMASKGYATVNIDYRMLDAVTPLECVYDAKAAVRWVKANAKKYNIDTNKIGACGASAGAHLAALLATTGNDPILEGSSGNLKFSSRINAGAGFATPTLTGRKTWPLGNSNAIPDWFDKISPYKHVSKDDAPLIFIHGSDDSLVSVEEAKDMHKLYQELGLRSELEVKEGKGHVFYMDMSVIDSTYKFFKEIFD